MIARDVDDISIGALAQVACLLEVAAPKAGNVHPARSFDDMTWMDFAVAAAAIAPVMDRAHQRSLGETVLDSVRATRAASGKNVNLGIILLLGVVATVRRGDDLRVGVRGVLDGLDADDCRRVYEAITLAAPGGLGKVESGDVHDEPPGDLIASMRLASDHDLIARQYANGFAEAIDVGVPRLEAALTDGLGLHDAVVRLHLELMARHPDSLITRKCGVETACESSARARAVLDAGWPSTEGLESFQKLDDWLRADGHRRNPGTSADLVAVILFLSLRSGRLPVPLP